MYLLFLSTFFLIGEQFESFDIFFISFNTFILVLVALNNIRILFPFWRELDSRFKLIGMKPAQEHLGIYEGITSYISQIHSMLYYPLKDSSVSITPRLYLSKGWIIQLIIGIIILIINHIIFVIFIDPQTFDTLFWLLISYIGVFLTYGAMVWHGLKARENFQQWIRTFEELRFWAESLESLPFIDVEET